MKEKLARKLARKNATIRQIAVLPFRISASGEVEVMLLTSRQTARFVIPKGWPMKGLPDWKAAAVEAKQEAGLLGSTGKKPIGTYRYWKRLKTIFVPVTVAVFAMEVRKEKAKWQEMELRHKRWLTSKQATSLVEEPELSTVIVNFALRMEKGVRPSESVAST